MGDKNAQYPPLEGYPLIQGNQLPGQPASMYPPIPPGPPQSIPYPPGPNNVVITQPPQGGGGGMMAPGVAPASAVPPGCPPGLEYLTAVDQLLVYQKLELLETFTSFETKNKYLITNTLGQKVYFAAEESGCLTRQCCGNIRPFEMKVIDNFGNQVINLNRPLACQGCCFPCCLQTMEVTAPPGTIVGTVEQVWSIFTPTYNVKNANGDIVFRIEGHCCACRCCSDVNFKVLTSDGSTEVGKISKKWTGIIREGLTDADNFGITFPVDLDVKLKATLMGALFLIDYMYFEDNQS